MFKLKSLQKYHLYKFKFWINAILYEVCFLFIEFKPIEKDSISDDRWYSIKVLTKEGIEHWNHSENIRYEEI